MGQVQIRFRGRLVFAGTAAEQETAELSSILKALKKLEDEHPRKTGGDAFLPQTLGVKKTLRRWEINSGRFAPLLWGALTVMVLAAAGWFFVYMRSPDESPAPMAQLPSDPLPAAAIKEQKAGLAGNPAKTVQSSTRSSKASKRRRLSLSGAAKSRSSPTASARKPMSQNQRQAVSTPPVNQTKVQTATGLPILKAELELQAVSWSPDPANRIAVINGSVIREGASIEGYSVVRIAEDEVQVRKGLSQWRLVFNLKK